MEKKGKRVVKDKRNRKQNKIFNQAKNKKQRDVQEQVVHQKNKYQYFEEIMHHFKDHSIQDINLQKDKIEDGIYRLREISFSSHHSSQNHKDIAGKKGSEKEEKGNKEANKEKGIIEQESDGTKDQKVAELE